MRAINPQILQREYKADPKRTVRYLAEALDSGQLKPRDCSVQDLFIGLVENGADVLASISDRKRGRMTLQEAAGQVDTTAFANITGQLVFNAIKEAYNFPEFLWPELCTVVPTNFLNGERIPGVGEIGDKAEIVGEGENFPEVGTNEEYIDTAPTQKRGFIVPITREIIIADRTGILLERCEKGGYWLGLNKEKRGLDAATGVTNNYKRNGVATNTYLSSGAYINYSASNALADWTSVQTAELLFDGMTDPNTGEPIILPAAQLLVPSGLRRTAHRILQASEVAHVDNTAGASTIRQFYQNPLNEGFYGQKPYKVLSNAFVKARSSSSTRWWFGDFKRAIKCMTAWEVETTQASDNSEQQFMRDVWMRFKCSVRDVFQITEPRFLTQNNV